MQIQNFITEQSFIGMNDRYPAHLLPPGVYQLLQNVTIDTQRLTKRKGTTKTATAIGGLAQKILGLGAYEPISGTRYQVACVNGASFAQVYYWTGSGTWTGLGSANFTKDAAMNFVQASNRIYGFNGSEVASLDSSITFTKNPATVPLGKFGVWFHNYLFVAGVTANPSRLYWSDLGDPTNFTGTNFFDVNPNDGDMVTGLYVFNDELYVFKNNTVWSITGFSGSTFSTTTIAGQNLNSRIFGFGTPSHRSIVSTGRDLYWISFNGGIPQFRSLTQTQFATTLEQGVVSYDLETTMSGLTAGSLSGVAGIYDGKYIRWGVPSGASTFNNLTLIFEPTIRIKTKSGQAYRSWVKWTGFNPSCFIQSSINGSPAIYFGDGAATGLVYQADTAAYSDNGTAIVMDVQSRDMRLDLARKAKFVYLYCNYKTGSAGSLNINARVDQGISFTTQQTLALAGTSPGLGPTGTFTLGTSVLGGSVVASNRTVLQHLTGHLLGVEYKEATANACEIYDWRVYGIPKGLRSS